MSPDRQTHTHTDTHLSVEVEVPPELKDTCNDRQTKPMLINLLSPELLTMNYYQTGTAQINLTRVGSYYIMGWTTLPTHETLWY